MNLSPHFTAIELGLRPDTPQDHVVALSWLCWSILEPIREHAGRPVRINRPSLGLLMRGWRPPETKVGSPTSQHRKGEAADLDFDGDLVQLWRWIAFQSKLPFGQCILEKSSPERNWGWIHVSLGAPWRPQDRCGQVLYFDGRKYFPATASTVLPKAA